MKTAWLVSACLLGERCRFDGGHCYDPAVEKLKKEATIIPVCPEMLGGLGVPRVPCEIAGGTGADVWNGNARVIDQTGRDCTLAFKTGAVKALELCKGVKNALVKSNSPSCGCGTIYDGSFSKTKRAGNGVLTECLLDAGINVVCDSNTADKSLNEWRKGNAGI